MKRVVVISMLVVAVANLSAVGGTALAGSSCKAFKPVAPDSASSNAADATKTKVIQVTDKATEKKPIVVEYSHGPAVADQSLGESTTGDPQSMMLLEDARFFNFQVASKARAAAVNIRIEWGSPSPSDIDLRLYGGSGSEIDSSVAFNPIYNDAYQAAFGGDDDNGMEQLLDVILTRCYGFTVESRPAWSPGEDAVTLKVWLN